MPDNVKQLCCPLVSCRFNKRIKITVLTFRVSLVGKFSVILVSKYCHPTVVTKWVYLCTHGFQYTFMPFSCDNDIIMLATFLYTAWWEYAQKGTQTQEHWHTHNIAQNYYRGSQEIHLIHSLAAVQVHSKSCFNVQLKTQQAVTFPTEVLAGFCLLHSWKKKPYSSSHFL
jgi:hypothetical protein